MVKAQNLGIYLKKMKIKDLNNRVYTITYLSKFIDHIRKYHDKGSSIHEENGYYFLVDKKFRDLVYKHKNMETNC